jgi:hypothetical protein
MSDTKQLQEARRRSYAKFTKDHPGNAAPEAFIQDYFTCLDLDFSSADVAAQLEDFETGFMQAAREEAI